MASLPAARSGPEGNARVLTKSAMVNPMPLNHAAPPKLELLASPNRFPLAFKPFRKNPVAAF